LMCGTKTGITNCYAYTPQSKTNIYGPMTSSAWIETKPNGSMVMSATTTCGNCINPPTEPGQAGGGPYSQVQIRVSVDGTYSVTACLSSWDIPSIFYLLAVTVTDQQGDSWNPIAFGYLNPPADTCANTAWQVSPSLGAMSITVQNNLPNATILVTVSPTT